MTNFTSNNKLSGINPLAYQGVEATTPPQLVVNTRRPTSEEWRNFKLGSLWVVTGTIQEVWMLIALANQQATWVEIYPGSGLGNLDFLTDAGIATVLANTIQVVGGAGITTSGAGDTVTISLSGGTPIEEIDGDTGFITGSTVSIKANADSGSSVVFEGDNATAMILRVTDNDGNSIIGFNGGNGTLTGTGNTSLGQATLFALTSGDENVAIGGITGNALTTGNNNTLVGTGAGIDIVSGNNNVALGHQAGLSYTGAESNNIVIGAAGTLGDSAKIRIGTQGTQTATHIVGIDGVNVGSVAEVVTMSAAGNQLGTAVITAGSGVTVTPGANTITIAATGGASSTSIWGIGASNLALTAGNLYFTPFGVGSLVQADNELIVPVNGTISLLNVRVGTNASTTNCSVTLYVNGIASALTTTLTALTTGTFSDAINSVAVVAGDRVAFFIQQSTVGAVRGTLSVRFVA